MSTKKDIRFFVRRNIQGSRVGEDMIIFDGRIGKYYATGQIGGDIWDMLAIPLAKEDICLRLLEVYAIDEPTCKKHVDDFLNNMLVADLIEAQV